MTEEKHVPDPAPVTAHPELRRALAARYGSTNYRIEADGTIWIRGPSSRWRRIGSVDGEKVRMPGRPTIGDKPARKITIYMTAEDQLRAQELGDGNISLGVRRALQIAHL
jgi:hypothetical protein